MKNKLTPVLTYFETCERQKNQVLSEEVSNLLRDIRPKAFKNLLDIKNMNTVFFKGIKTELLDVKKSLSFAELYRLIIGVFEAEFIDDIEVNLVFNAQKDILENRSSLFLINEILFIFLLEEIAMNARKHISDGSIMILFNCDTDGVEVKFSNRRNRKSGIEDIEAWFNKEDLSVHLEKNYKGLTLVKRNFVRLGIKHSLNCEGDLFVLSFKILYNEGIGF